MGSGPPAPPLGTPGRRRAFPAGPCRPAAGPASAAPRPPRLAAPRSGGGVRAGAGAARPARPRRPPSLPPWRLSGRSRASSSCSSTPRRGERPAPGKGRAAGRGQARWGPEAAGAGARAGPGPTPWRSRAQAEPGRPRGSRRRGAAHPEGSARGLGGAWGVSGLGGPPTPTPRPPAPGPSARPHAAGLYSREAPRGSGTPRLRGRRRCPPSPRLVTADFSPQANAWADPCPPGLGESLCGRPDSEKSPGPTRQTLSAEQWTLL